MTEFANGLSSERRLYVNGEPRAADYPESLEAWQTFFAGKEVPRA